MLLAEPECNPLMLVHRAPYSSKILKRRKLLQLPTPRYATARTQASKETLLLLVLRKELLLNYPW
jgi:hypothetical protein